MKTKIFGLLVIGLLAVMPAMATPIIDFGVIAPTAGSISFAGGINPLVGAGIEVDNVTGLTTPLNSGIGGQRNLLGGVLAFTSGPLVSWDPSSYTFAPGGSIVITGCADLDNSGTCNAGDATGVLMTGSFSTNVSVLKSNGATRVVAAGFLDTKNPVLAAFYGLGSVTTWEGAINLSFNSTQGFGPSTSAARRFASTQVLSGDITNSPAVPEPASLLLLAAGLLGTGVVASRRK